MITVNLFTKFHSRDASKAKTNISESKAIETSIYASRRKSSMNVDVSLSVKFDELQWLREKCNTLEESECTLKSKVEQLKFELSDKEDMIDKLTRESQTYQLDLETYIAKSNVSIST